MNMYMIYNDNKLIKKSYIFLCSLYPVVTCTYKLIIVNVFIMSKFDFIKNVNTSTNRCMSSCIYFSYRNVKYFFSSLDSSEIAGLYFAIDHNWI